jgi:hypothetical protein
MAKVIEFYVPDRFVKKSKWVPADQRGKVLAFESAVKRTA